MQQAETMQSESLPPRYWIGSSDIAGVLGISPFTTPLQVYLKITGQAPELTQEDEEFFAGRKALEPYVLQKLKSKFGVTPSSMNVRYSDPEFPFMRAEIDAEEVEDNYEIKTVHPARARDWGDSMDEFPIYVAAQAQYGLMIRPKPRAWVTPCIGFDLVKRYPVEPDPEVQAVLRAAAVTFWEEHILPRVPPPPKSIEDCLALFPRSTSKPIMATDEILQMLQLHNVNRQAEKAAEFAKDEASVKIRAFMGEADTLLQQGVGIIATYRSNKDSVKTDFEKLVGLYEHKLSEFMLAPEAYFAASRSSCTSTKPGNRPFLNKLK